MRMFHLHNNSFFLPCLDCCHTAISNSLTSWSCTIRAGLLFTCLNDLIPTLFFHPNFSTPKLSPVCPHAFGLDAWINQRSRLCKHF